MKLLFVVLLSALACICIGEEEAVSPPRLLVEKKILNKYLVENRDIIVHFFIVNVGGSPAVDVQITDESMPEEHFTVVNGISKFAISRIAPGANVTHTIVYRPKMGVAGRFNFTAAEVTYLHQEGAKSAQRGYTSEPGEGYIVSLKEFDRRFSPHVLDWVAFSVMTLPSLVIPFLLWFRSKSRYESIVGTKANKRH